MGILAHLEILIDRLANRLGLQARQPKKLVPTHHLKLLAVCFLLPLTACASVGDPSDPDYQILLEINDPYEGFNRQMFDINLFFDRVILKPTAKVYIAITPGILRAGVDNALHNFDTPTILLNDILQGEIGRAGHTTGRFLINTTVGIGGLFDPAKRLGLERHNEDFGQTLAVWGFGPGPYLMVPGLGPMPPRHLIGFVVDHFTEPLTHVDGNTAQYVGWGLTALDLIQTRSENIDTLDDIERTSLDFYAASRSFYRQLRKSEIHNGEEDFEDLPDFDFDFDEEF